jgi:hypothetical protein
MNCEKIQAWLVEEANADLSNLSEAMQGHISECAGCQAVIEGLMGMGVVKIPEKLLAEIPCIKREVLFAASRAEEKAIENYEPKLFQPAMFTRFGTILMLCFIAIFGFWLANFYCINSDRQALHKAQKKYASAVITRVNKDVNVSPSLNEGDVAAVFSEPLLEGDFIKTEQEASTELTFVNGTIVALGANGVFRMGINSDLGELLKGRAVISLKDKNEASKTMIHIPRWVVEASDANLVLEAGETYTFVGVSSGVIKLRSEVFGERVLETGESFLCDHLGHPIKVKDMDGDTALTLRNLKAVLKNMKNLDRKHISVYTNFKGSEKELMK